MEGILGFILFISITWIVLKLISSNGNSKGRSNKTSYSPSSNKDQGKFYYSQAWICSEKKDYRNAIYYYNKAISYDKSSTYYNNRGHAKAQISDYSGALEDYTLAIQFSPHEALYWYNRGMAHHNNGKDSLACSDWEQASTLGSEGAKKMLATYCQRWSEVRDAQKSLTNHHLNNNQLTNNELVNTEWHLVSFDTSLKDKEIKLGSNGRLVIADYENNSSNSWSKSNNKITLKLNGGYATYHGTLMHNEFKGTAKNIKGETWDFVAKLKSSEDTTAGSTSYSIKGNSSLSQAKEADASSTYRVRKPNWEGFNKVLSDNNISKLYHFTDKRNIASIRKYGALYSWQYCANNNISIPQAGGDELSRKLDVRHGVQNYVRLSFARNHPMMYHAQSHGRLGNTVVLEICPEVVFWRNTKYSNKNATRNDAKIGLTLEDFKRIKFDIIRQPNHFDLSDEDKPFYQAEVLVFESIPIKYILNINNI